MDRTWGPYAKWNKLDKDKCCMVSVLFEIFRKKNLTYKQRVEKWLQGAESMEKIDRECKRVKMFSYKM